MPKVALPVSALFTKWIAGDENFKVENRKIFCRLCLKSYEFKKKFELKQHIGSFVHQSKLQSGAGDGGRQQLLTEIADSSTTPKQTLQKDRACEILKEGTPRQTLEKGSSKLQRSAGDSGRQQFSTDIPGSSKSPDQENFEKDIVIAFVKEGIPLSKLEKGPLREFLDKYCGDYKVPSVSQLLNGI